MSAVEAVVSDKGHARAQRLRLAALAGAVLTSLALSFSVTRGLVGWIKGSPSAGLTPAFDSAAAAARMRRLYPSGNHLVAYVILSHQCGFSTEEGTRAAVSQIRSSLKVLEGRQYAKVSVVGVNLEFDIKAGFEYLRSLERTSRAFDQLSLGGGWLNEFITDLVWREKLAKSATPTVILVRRRVDTNVYPVISVERDSVLLAITGRAQLINWVSEGTPLRDAANVSQAIPRTATSGAR